MGVPSGYADLFGDDSRAFLVLATTRPDGAMVIATVWFVAGSDLPAPGERYTCACNGVVNADP